MSLHHIPLASLSAEHFTRLIGVPESKTCDYKVGTHRVDIGDQKAQEGQWQDFLSDLASFANADGGDLIYGIAEGEGEQKGVATEIVGLTGFVKDDWVMRAEAKMRVGIHPNMTGVRFQEFEVDGKKLLLVRVPRSHMAPHAVKLGKGQHFCTRGEQGKVELDVSGIRSAFLTSEGLADRLRGFRLERISKLLPEIAPPSNEDCSTSGALIVHVLPYEAARPGFALESSTLLDAQKRNNPNFLMHHTGWGPRYNYDGLAFRNDPTGQRVTLFRRGFFEVVDMQLAQRWRGTLVIRQQEIEKNLLSTLPAWLKELELSGFSGPFLFSISMLGVSGATFLTARHYVPVNDQTPIDRDMLLSDEVEVPIDSTPVELAGILKPVFDQIWNAVGVPASPSYTEAGVCKLLRNQA